MMYGMSYEEFWRGEPYLVEYYWEKHKLEIEERNQELWLQGLYIHNAFAVVMQNAFAKRGSKLSKYLEKPLDILPQTKEEKERKIQREREKVIAFFSNLKVNN